jgi:hypothetical protein
MMKHPLYQAHGPVAACTDDKPRLVFRHGVQNENPTSVFDLITKNKVMIWLQTDDEPASLIVEPSTEPAFVGRPYKVAELQLL